MNTEAIRSVAAVLRGIHAASYDRRWPFGFNSCGSAGSCAAFAAAMLNPAEYENARRASDDLRLKRIAAAELGITGEQATELFRINPLICVHAYEYVKIDGRDITKDDLADVLEHLAGTGAVNWSYCYAGEKALAREGLADDPDDPEFG